MPKPFFLGAQGAHYGFSQRQYVISGIDSFKKHQKTQKSAIFKHFLMFSTVFLLFLTDFAPKH